MLVTRMVWGIMVTDLPAEPALMPRIEFTGYGRAVMEFSNRFLLEVPLPRNWYFVVLLPCR